MSFAARAPALLHPETTNSDCALVGLQAMHVLRGEFSPLLLGSHYQTSVDAFWAAGFFALLGPSPFALMLSALTLHVVSTLLVYAVLERTIGPARAFLLACLLVFTGAVVHSYALYPPRQAALTLVFMSLFAFVPRSEEPPSRARLAAGGALGAFAIFADPYALVMLPALVVMAALVVRPRARAGPSRAIAFLLGAAAGLVPFVLLTRHPEWKSGEAGLATAVIPKNLSLLWASCGPWAFGSMVFRPTWIRDYTAWSAPAPLSWLLRAGAATLAAAAFVAPLAALLKSSGGPARRVSLVGATMAWATLTGFLLSVMVMDHFSMRYLVAAILAAPLSMAALAARLSPKALSALLVAPLATGLVGGLAALGPVTASPLRWVSLPGHDDEQRAVEALVGDGIRFGVADYWVSYRLTFLARERLVVVPSHRAQDRHLPYRALAEKAPRHAYIVDKYRSDEAAESVHARLRASGAAFERRDFGSIVAFVGTGPVPTEPPTP